MGFKLSDTKNSRYLAKEDAGMNGLNLTVSHCTREELENDDKKEMKIICHWVERDNAGDLVKPIVIGPTNYQLVCVSMGLNPSMHDTDDWVGKRVNVYNDPLIVFKGEVKGGLRIRRPTDEPTPAQQYRDAQAVVGAGREEAQRSGNDGPVSFEQAMKDSGLSQ